MGKINDNQILLQLTSDVIAYEIFKSKGHGRRVNGKHGYVLKHCPLVRKLLDKGVCTLKRMPSLSWGGSSNYNYLQHPHPRETPPTCPCCKKVINYAPEINMIDHSKDCRLRVYYDKPAVKASRSKADRLMTEKLRRKIKLKQTLAFLDKASKLSNMENIHS